MIKKLIFKTFTLNFKNPGPFWLVNKHNSLNIQNKLQFETSIKVASNIFEVIFLFSKAKQTKELVLSLIEPFNSKINQLLTTKNFLTYSELCELANYLEEINQISPQSSDDIDYFQILNLLDEIYQHELRFLYPEERLEFAILYTNIVKHQMSKQLPLLMCEDVTDRLFEYNFRKLEFLNYNTRYV